MNSTAKQKATLEEKWLAALEAGKTEPVETRPGQKEVNPAKEIVMKLEVEWENLFFLKMKIDFLLPFSISFTTDV